VPTSPGDDYPWSPEVNEGRCSTTSVRSSATRLPAACMQHHGILAARVTCQVADKPGRSKSAFLERRARGHLARLVDDGRRVCN